MITFTEAVSEVRCYDLSHSHYFDGVSIVCGDEWTIEDFN